MYTVTFFSQTLRTLEASYFPSQKAAVKYASWLATKAWASGVKVYRGEAGGEVIFEAVS